MSQKYLVLKGCAGLGNRLFCVCDAINYAERNQRILYVDWDDGQMAPFGINAFEEFFELKNVAHTYNKNDLKGTSNPATVHAGDGGIYNNYFVSTSSAFSKIPLRLIPKGRSRMVNRYWRIVSGSKKAPGFFTHLAGIFNKQNFPFGSDLKDSLPEQNVVYCDFSPAFDKRVFKEKVHFRKNIQQEITAFANTSQLVSAAGVHIRSTDKKPTRSVGSLIELLKTNKEEQIFLATDNKEIETLFKNTFPSVLSFPKYLPDNQREGLHQHALYSGKEALKLQITKESIMDLGLLASCKKIYYQGNSSFSDIALAMHSNPAQCINWLTHINK